MRSLLAAALLLLAGCSAELSAGLTERQADEIVLALDEASIAADKERERGGATYRVTVDREAIPAALGVLRERGLPREPTPGLEALLDGPGLIESANAERARYAAAIGGELARSLETMEGIRRARVHLALGPEVGAPLDEPPPPSSASVLLSVERGASIDEGAVRALISGAVPRLDAERVTVVQSEVAARAPADPGLTRVGPFAVRRADAPVLKAVLAGSFALNLALVLLIVALVRSRRSRPVSPRVTPTPET